MNNDLKNKFDAPSSAAIPCCGAAPDMHHSNKLK
jgi:hypothetical protein